LAFASKPPRRGFFETVLFLEARFVPRASFLGAAFRALTTVFLPPLVRLEVLSEARLTPAFLPASVSPTSELTLIFFFFEGRRLFFNGSGDGAFFNNLISADVNAR
jgi:hypothetical protein